MMEDLLNFRTFKETLGTNGFRDIKVSENSIFCKAIICEHTIGLKGVLPETFPYESVSYTHLTLPTKLEV